MYDVRKWALHFRIVPTLHDITWDQAESWPRNVNRIHFVPPFSVNKPSNRQQATVRRELIQRFSRSNVQASGESGQAGNINQVNVSHGLPTIEIIAPPEI